MATSAYDLLEETRNSIEEIIPKMLFIKKEGKGRAELHELISEVSVLFLKLRQANRIIFQEEDRVKSETENAKIPVDYTTLQLHNLMYEKNHYLKAIKGCKDFKSKYPDIELVSEEEFF
uniref:TSA: Wollemia nobilis Ref_Wollemi_Transcript_267_723 transcribed RNA sequence n=1 Tax=Wollemia nobilis TaxID=56998 RepID=A0A0C9RZF2_9CONI